MGMKSDKKALSEETNLRVQCPYCKHKNMIPVFLDEKLCYWCNRKIKNNTELYFKYKLRKEIRKLEDKNEQN